MEKNLSTAIQSNHNKTTNHLHYKFVTMNYSDC